MPLMSGTYGNIFHSVKDNPKLQIWPPIAKQISFRLEDPLGAFTSDIHYSVNLINTKIRSNSVSFIWEF